MIKIGVISDTHLQAPSQFLEETAERYFDDADLILHAGDLISLDVLKVFKGKEVVAVAGNSDSAEIKQTLPGKKILTVNHFRIGLIHGWGLPMGLDRRVALAFDDVHCIVFGHSHMAVNQGRNGVLLFNPGSFSGGVSSLWRRSVGLLTIDKGIQGEIIRL